jgi:hypothetical protein
MYANQDPTQTRNIPTRLKLLLAVPLAILLCQLLFLAFAGASDPMQAPW